MDAMKMPAMVRVAGFDIEVVAMTTHDACSRARYGEFSPLLMRISIDEGLPRQKKVDTLLHEVLHAIWWAYNIHDGDVEERMCGTLSTALTLFFGDNPDMVAWCSAGAKPIRDERLL